MRRWFAGSWIRTVEHGALRGGSLVCSLVSAYAIHLFFAPLGTVDKGELILTWGVAGAFGVLGYVVPRGMVHRMMNRESIWAYAPVCFLIELVDISCNYVLAASAARDGFWLVAVPSNQQGLVVFLSYLIRSVIPLMSIVLAVVDMDLERKKSGGGEAIGKPLVRREAAPQVARMRLNQTAQAPEAANNAGAKRAQYWAKQQTQHLGTSGARGLMADPEKEMALNGVE